MSSNQTMRFHSSSFTGKAPRKGSRTPLNINKYSEQRDEETGYGYFGARYMDHELMTMWLSVDPMADKYPNISPYAYCAWNPVKLVDPDGKDVEIVKDDEHKVVTVRANFYYDPEKMGDQAAFFMKKFMEVLDAWGEDMQTALNGDGSLGAFGYTVSFEYQCIESSNPEMDASNDKDGIGNWINSDPNMGAGISVINNREIKMDFGFNRGNEKGYDEWFYDTEHGTLKHEIGHIFGLRDRYPEAINPAPYIPKDLMTIDLDRGNAVEPFKRVWKSAGFHTGTKYALINHSNRESVE